MRKVFISHPFSDNPELRRKQVDYICRNLDDDIIPISPLHLFSMYEEEPDYRGEILQVCFNLIDICDEAYFYVYGSLSAGQEEEIDYVLGKAKKGDIDFITTKPPQKCLDMVEGE